VNSSSRGPSRALDASLALVDPVDLRNTAFSMRFRAEAHVQQAAVGDASGTIGAVARRTALGRSRRSTPRIGELRGMLTPGERTAPVRELDAQLATYGPARHRTTRT
jgi:hypothetical protein